MSIIGWIILLVLVVPIIGLLGWPFLAASFVSVPSGSLGLVMIKGQATVGVSTVDQPLSDDQTGSVNPQ